MTNLDAYNTLKRFITSERYMREQVFRDGHKAREKKLAECDKADAALEHMRQVMGVVPEVRAKQESLF